MLTSLEKNIYNTYLRVSRTAKNQPFSYRKDFTDFDDSKTLWVKRIGNLLFKYPHIEAEEYFRAPFKVYPNAEHFTLEYFAGMGAVSAYSLYMKQIQEMPPDSEEQLKFIQKSLKYIGTYCIRNKINVNQYATAKTGVTFDWMKHVKKHEVSVYALMEFPEISKTISEAAEDEKELFLGDVGLYFWGYKTKYIQSEIAKQLVKEGISAINKVVKSKINE